MKYYNYDIVFQEVPDEVSLAINFSNCPNHCKGCHSPHLCEDIGTELDDETLSEIISKYKHSITCVCFMGGDSNQERIIEMAQYINEHFGLKVAWYSGKSEMPKDITPFHYLKIGPYIQQFGGLDKTTTNQRMYKINGTETVDITKRFWKKAI
ncbi:MAG: anaerobic ribonucleoside-triphosphate reductase activating protein [Bacteroidales bacterium]|nr:anaerobic ribonucleoside-triphosphate reductase activating protein [Bacteroidales bacterium]